MSGPSVWVRAREGLGKWRGPVECAAGGTVAAAVRAGVGRVRPYRRRRESPGASRFLPVAEGEAAGPG
ncbi:hypothetical protein ABZ061_33320 [Streptomyces mutabilis]|uniref:hypothetical protein n=1 Tax=Streptomyces mutabilis TaxID=67332 RepID=UPI0033A3C1B8